MPDRESVPFDIRSITFESCHVLPHVHRKVLPLTNSTRLIGGAEASVVARPLALNPIVTRVRIAHRVRILLPDRADHAPGQAHAVAGAERPAELPGDHALVARVAHAAPVAVVPRLTREQLVLSCRYWALYPF